MGAVDTATGMGTGQRRKCRQKAQQLTQMDSSGEAVSFQAVGGRGAGGWGGDRRRGFRPGLGSSGGAVSLGHLHLIIHLFIYSFMGSLVHEECCRRSVSRTGGELPICSPSLREQPSSITCTPTWPLVHLLGNWSMCSTFSGMQRSSE